MLLMIAAIVATVVVINSVMPAVQRTGSDIVAASDVVGNRLRSDVKIIETTGVDGEDTVQVWVKNTGAAQIPSLESIDVFFGETTNFERVSYDELTTCPNPLPPPRTEPCWQYELENASEWDPFATLRISIYLDYDLASGTEYVVNLVMPNGIAVSRTFTV
jgi:hypothetical protein